MDKTGLQLLLQANRPNILSTKDAYNLGLHWTQILGIANRFGSINPRVTAQKLNMPPAVFALEQSLYCLLDPGEERCSWIKSIIQALPHTLTAERDGGIRRYFARSLLTHCQYGLAASFGDEPLPVEIADIIALIGSTSNNDGISAATYADAAQAAQEALPAGIIFVSENSMGEYCLSEQGMADEIRHLGISAVADFAWHFAEPTESKHPHFMMAANYVIKAAAKSAQLRAYRALPNPRALVLDRKSPANTAVLVPAEENTEVDQAITLLQATQAARELLLTSLSIANDPYWNAVIS